MYNLAYSIIITLLHSVWQMAILLLLYYCIVAAFRSWPPLAKRNLLLSSLGVQGVVSIATFFLVYVGSQQNLLEPAFQLNWLSPSTSLPQQWFSYLLILYIAGFSYKLLGSYLKWKKQVAHLQNHLQKAPAEVRLFTSQKALAFGIKRNVEIWFSEHISSPLTYGFLKPVILFPVALFNQLSFAQTEALIVHELTHIRTRDYLFNWALVIAESIYFFNPFVKIIAKNIRLEREKNCDVKVIDFSYSTLQYAEALLQVAHNSTQQYRLPIPAVRSKEELLKRIQFFSQGSGTEQKNNYSIWPMISLMLAFLLFLNLALFNLVKKEISTQELAANFPLVLNTGYDRYPGNEIFASFSNEPVNPSLENKETAYPLPQKTIQSEINNHELAESVDLAQTEPSAQNYSEPVTADYVIPVAFTSAPAPEVKEMIITEENSAGEKITKSYTVVLENGEWKIQPQWMYTEKPLNDSLKAVIKLDSTILQVFPTIQ